MGHGADDILHRNTPVSLEQDSTYQVALKALDSARTIKETHAGTQIPDFEHSDSLDMTIYIKRDLGSSSRDASSQDCP